MHVSSLVTTFTVCTAVTVSESYHVLRGFFPCCGMTTGRKSSEPVSLRSFAVNITKETTTSIDKQPR